MSGDFYGVFNDALGLLTDRPDVSRYGCMRAIATTVLDLIDKGASKDDVVAALNAAARCESGVANISARSAGFGLASGTGDNSHPSPGRGQSFLPGSGSNPPAQANSMSSNAVCQREK